MKSSVVKLLTVLIVFFSLVMLNQSCKKVKEDAQIKSEIHVTKHPLEDRFLAVPDSMPGTLKKIAAYIKKQKNKSAFIANIISQVGLPDWEKSLLIAKSATLNRGTNRGSGTGADSNYVFVPVVPIGTKEVDGALACLVVGDSVDIKFLNEKDFRQYGFDAANSKNAENLVGLMMYLQNKAYGTESFVLNDGRLFSNVYNASDSARNKVIRFKNKDRGVASRTDKSNTLIAAYYATIEICFEVWAPPCGDPLVCGYQYVQSYQCNTYAAWVDDGGSSSGGDAPPSGSGGGGGGATGSTSTAAFLQTELGLTNDEVDFLNYYPQLAEEAYNYINSVDGQLTTGERKQLITSHIKYLREDSRYLSYCLAKNEENYSVTGKMFPWFRTNTLQDDYPDLASNIQMLKLNAKQAFYLFNSIELNTEIQRYLIANNFSDESKYIILTKLYPEQYPGISFNNITSPSNVPDDPIIDNGISVEDIPQTPPSQTGRLIGKTTKRNNTEDMQYGTTGDVSGILASEVAKDNNALFSNMSNLFYWCTVRDSELASVGNSMIERFRTNTSPSTVYENPVLNRKVEYSAAFVNFLKLFGNTLRDRLIEKQGNINDVSEINMGKVRPVFNGLFNMTNGLQILINDTEYTEIQLDEFYLDINGKWIADVTVTIYDHFGLDKLDALTFQNKHSGFADWWLLQHKRNFVPYTTKVTVRKRISGRL